MLTSYFHFQVVMGVSVETWRQRIGCFRQRPSFSSKATGEVNSSPSSPVFGMGSTTFCVILFSVLVGNVLLPYLYVEDIAACGDVETNPGPGTPLLSEDLLTSLKNGTCTTSAADLGHGLKNKHIMQLFSKKDERDGTHWPSVFDWMKVLYPSWSQDDKKGQRQLRDSWTKLKQAYTKKNKNKGKSGFEEEMEIWKETDYLLPSSTKPPKASTSSTPQSTSSTPQSLFEVSVDKAEIDKLLKANETLTKKNVDLQQQVEDLLQRPSPHTQKLMKRREHDHWFKIHSEREHSKCLEKEKAKLENRLEKTKRRNRNLTSEFESKAKVAKTKTKGDLDWHESYTVELEDDNAKLREKVVILQEKVDQLMGRVDELTGELIESKDRLISFYDSEKRCFLPLIHKCVWNLISKHVSFANVSDVIASVLNMCGLKYDRLPSESTIRNMNKDRTLISQIQVASIANKTTNKDTTIQTDETPKNAEIFMTYAITDQDGEAYLLGLRQMASKSAQHTLDTLKETLTDITDICQKAKAGNNIGHKVLCQIRNTMSDRAATESLFNKMLQTYREECLVLYKENWENFSDEAKAKLTEMHNFFCGLHLLTSMADAVSASFKTFESNFLDGKKVGATAEFGIHVFNTASGCIRLVQNACKALSRGGDEKNGCHRHWKVYKHGVNLSKTFFLPFRGNRFNVVFMFGGRVYYLINHIKEFLGTVHGTTNGLLKALLADAKEPLYVAGCKVLGIVNKAISAPLWRVTEKDGHILDLCEIYTGLVQFLEKVTQDADRLADFAYGRINFFDDVYIEKDEVYEAVLSPGPYDEIVLSMLQHTLLTLLQLFKRVCVNYLPGGEFDMIKDDQEKRQATISVPLHNKLPERVFGYFDFLTKKRPNASAAANEAQVMYTFNKTGAFIDGKTEAELEELVNLVKSQRSKSKSVAKARQDKINEYWKSKQEASAKAMAESRQRALNKKENLTNDIVDTGLFQTNEQVDEYLNSQDSDNKKFETIKKQIRFRREVLNQYMDGDKGFTFTTTTQGSKKRVNKPMADVKSHLVKLINAAKSVAESVSVQKTPDNDILTIPLLVGKTVKHIWTTEEGDQSYIGKVISQVPGFPSWFNIKYNDDPKVYSLRLVDDYKDKSLSILI